MNLLLLLKYYNSPYIVSWNRIYFMYNNRLDRRFNFYDVEVFPNF